MSSVRHARPDTEGERLTSTSQHPVTHRDRVVHRFAQSGVARRRTGVQSLGYGPGPHAERVIESRFEAVISNLQVSVENQSAARSRIMDADYAVETSNLSRDNILQQAGNAMVAQDNQLPQQVLTLLR